VSSISENPVGLSAIGEGAGSDALLDIAPYAPLSISASDTVVYREAIRLNVTDPLELQITATSVLGRKVVYDDTGVITLSETGNAYEFPALSSETLAATGGDLGPVSQNAISDFQFDGGTNYFPSVGELVWNIETGVIKSVSRSSTGALEIAASDNDDGSEGVARQDGRREYPWFRPAFAIDIDVATFKTIAATSVEYYFDTRAEITQDNPGIPVGPISLSSVSEEQFVGFNDFFPSIGELVWNVETGIIKSVSRSSTGALEIGAVDNDDASAGITRPDGKVEYPWFRPAVGLDVETVPFKTIGAFSTEYKFDAAPGNDESAFAPLAVISENSIAELGQTIGPAKTALISDTIVLEISVDSVEVLYQEIIQFTDISTGALEVGATDNVNSVVTISDTGVLEVDIVVVETATIATTDTASLEVAVDAIIGKTFVYDDTAVLGKASATSVEVTSGTVDTTALVIGVDSVVGKTFVYEDSTALEVGAVSDNTLSVDSVETIVLTVEATATDVRSYDPAEGNAEIEIGVAQITPFTVDRTLSDPDPDGTFNTEQYGEDVAVSGDRAVVGSKYEYGTRGAAYLYNVTTGALIATLTNPDASSNDNFGARVDISDDYVIVSSWFDGNPFGAGSACIFSAVDGSFITKINNPNTSGDTVSEADIFSFDVAISNNYVAISAYGEDLGGTNSGAVYIYSTTDWSLSRTIANPNAYGSRTDDRFAQSLALDDNILIAGVSREDAPGSTSSGVAYVFDVSTGSRLHTFYNPSPNSSDGFGGKVDISGNYAVVGAVGDDTTGNNSGRAYIYDITTGVLTHTLENPNDYGTTASDAFGSAVAISSNYAIVGASEEDIAGKTSTGRVYVFDVASGSLVHTYDNPASNPADSDQFGKSVSITDGYAIAGHTDNWPEKVFILKLGNIPISTTLNSIDTAELEIDATVLVPTLVSTVDTTALEVAATDAVEQTFAYTDTGVFAKAGATSIETTSGSIDTTALIITGVDAIANTFAYADSAVFVKLGVDETDNTFDIVDTTTVELAATDATEITNTFNHPAALEISASSPESVSETSTGALEVVGQDSIEQTFAYTDTGVFAKAGATSIEVTSGTVDTTALIITGADAIANTFAYADSAVFAKLVATDEDIVYDIQDTTNLQVAVDDVYERAVAVDDSADLETTASDTQRSSVSRVTQGALEVDANILLGITEASFAPLQIAGDEQLGKTFVYQDTGVFRTIDASSTEISYNRDFTGELEIAGQDSIQQLFTYDDVGVFRAVAAFDLDTVTSITDTTALEISASDVFSQTTSRITQGALEVAVEGPHTFAINRSSTAPLEIAEDGTISVAYDYADTGVFAKLAADETAFTTNRDAIGELEIAAQEAIVQIFNTEDVAALGALVVSDQQIVFVFDTVTANLFSVLSDQSSTQNFAADPALSIDTDATNSIAYTQPQDTIETVIDSISVVNKTFAYDDTAEFGLLGASDSENIFNFEYVEFNTFGATDDVDVVYNFGSEAPALEAGDTATQSSTRQFADEVDFVTFVAASSEILVNIENEGILGFGVTDDVDIVYNFQPQAFIETTATDDITQSVSRRTTAPLKVGVTTNQYYYTKFKQIYANDTIEFSLKGDSNEMKVSGAVEVTGADKQTWIG